MKRHIRQARHNIRLHEELCTMFPDEFHDWKVTMLFYTALHWVRALAEKRNIAIGRSHLEIEHSCNPVLRGAMPISRRAWEEYHKLSKRSQAGRYHGIPDEVQFNKMHLENHCLSIPGINYLRKYVQGMGIDI